MGHLQNDSRPTRHNVKCNLLTQCTWVKLSGTAWYWWLEYTSGARPDEAQCRISAPTQISPVPHHYSSGGANRERERTEGGYYFSFIIMKCETTTRPQWNADHVGSSLAEVHRRDTHLNIEVFKCDGVSPKQFHGILWDEGDAKKALHLVRPRPLCHLRCKTRDNKPLVKCCHKCSHIFKVWVVFFFNVNSSDPIN